MQYLVATVASLISGHFRITIKVKRKNEANMNKSAYMPLTSPIRNIFHHQMRMRQGIPKNNTQITKTNTRYSFYKKMNLKSQKT